MPSLLDFIVAISCVTATILRDDLAALHSFGGGDERESNESRMENVRGCLQ